MSDKSFIDSSVLLYLNERDGNPKKNEVKSLLLTTRFVSPQVIFECLNVCIRKFGYSKKKAVEFVSNIQLLTEMTEENSAVVELALKLYLEHSLQVFDSKIIASAIINDCRTLLTEYMHHKQIFENKLHIVNPFFALKK